MVDDSDEEMGDPLDHIESNQWRTIQHNEYKEGRNPYNEGWEQWQEGTGGYLDYDTRVGEETTNAQVTFTRARDGHMTYRVSLCPSADSCNPLGTRNRSKVSSTS